jgi:pimeloyl-ACP methyl ester carboxylesterase
MSRDIRHIKTPMGDIAYEERGSGPPAVFVHGVFLNGYLWRHVVDRVADVPEDSDLSFPAQAEMLEAFCDALSLEQVDLVGNDSGGGIAQIFAAHYPHRLKSLTLTNCDVHDNWPPEAFQPTMRAVAEGRLKEMGEAMLADIETARAALGVGYEHPQHLTEETVRTYLEPLQGDVAVRNLERWFDSLDCAQTVAVEDQLRQLVVPTLIVWGTADIFFDVKWANWLRDTIPGAREVIELDGAKLFFPEERTDEFAAALRNHWDSAASTEITDGALAER